MEDEDKKVYLIYRVYSAKERKDVGQRTVFYGWTDYKSVKDAFIMQRDQKKYKAIKAYRSEMGSKYSMYMYDTVNTRGEDAFGDYIHYLEECMDDRNMINYIKLWSANTNDEVPFFTTADELHEAEIRIQRLKEDLCSMETLEGKRDARVYLEMIINLDPYYADALRYIGYRPKELDILFDSVGSEGTLEDVEMQIHAAYDGYAESPKENITEIPGLPGLSVLEDVSSRVIYSLENFIKVLKEDL